MSKSICLITDALGYFSKNELAVSIEHYLLDLPSYINKLLIAGNGCVSHLLLRAQVGESPATDDQIISVSSELLETCRKHRAKLIIHRNPELAMRINADGVHLQKGSVCPKVVRNTFGDKLLIGYSSHSMDEVTYAEEVGCDYAFISPVSPSISKQDGRPPLELSQLCEILEVSNIPLFALGGINSKNARQFLKEDLFGVAILGAVSLAENPEEEMNSLGKCCFNVE